MENDPRFYLLDRNSGVRFLVDTGADLSYFPPDEEDCEELDAKGASQIRIADFGGNEMEILGEKLVRFDFGPGREFSWRCCITSQSIPVIGFDLLSYYGLVVDVKNKKLETLDPTTNEVGEHSWRLGDVDESCLPEAGTWPEKSGFFVTGTSSSSSRGHPSDVEMVVDTGAAFGYIQARPEQISSGPLYAIACGVKVYGSSKVKVHLPGHDKPLTCMFKAAHPLMDNLLGADFLTEHELKVDCKNMRILYPPSGTEDGGSITRVFARAREMLAGLRLSLHL